MKPATKSRDQVRLLGLAKTANFRVQTGIGALRMRRQLTAIVEREDNGYVVLCPEVDVASQGVSVAEARANLEEALALYFEAASSEEIERRLRSEVYVTHVIRQSGLPRSEFE